MSLERLGCPHKIVASDPSIHILLRSLRFPGISTRIPRTLSNSRQKSELLHNEGFIIKERESPALILFQFQLAVHLVDKSADSGIKMPGSKS